MELTGKLPIKVKLAFGIGDMGKNCLILLNTYFLLYFYTDVVNIPAAAAATIMLVARIWDAINDPMMGVLVDKTKSREGKCRFYLKYFSLPAGACLALSYFVPELTSSGKIIWVAVTYIFQGMFTTVTSVPLNALMARLTDDRLERVSIGQYKAAGSIVANLVIPAITLPLVTYFGGVSLQKGFAVVAIIYGIMYALCHLITYWGTKGYEKSYEEEKDENISLKAESISIRSMLKATVSNKVFMVVCLSYIFYLLYASLMGSTLVYYLQYNLKKTELLTAYSLIGTSTAIVIILFMKPLSKKIGNAKTCAFACLLALANYTIRFITKDQIIPVLYICWGIEGIGLGLFGNLIFQCVLDSMIYGKWKTGVDNQAVIMSVFTFAQKFGQAIGGVIAAYLLGVVSYDPMAAEQTERVLRLFFAENITIPAIIFAFTFFIFIYISKVETKIPQMQKEIEIRSEKVNMQK